MDPPRDCGRRGRRSFSISTTCTERVTSVSRPARCDGCRSSANEFFCGDDGSERAPPAGGAASSTITCTMFPTLFDLLSELGALSPGGLTVIVERDGTFRPFEALLRELDRARGALALGRSRVSPPRCEHHVTESR